MKSRLALLFVSSLVWAAVTSSLQAQTPRAPNGPSSTVVAVLDVKKVFDNHPQFKQQVEGIKREVEAFEQELEEHRVQMTREVEALKLFKPGSPEYKQKEKALAQQESNLRLRAQLKRKEVLEKEAKLYYETYQHIVSVVGEIADRYGIGLVLRYDSEEVDGSDRAEILRNVNRSVVFQRNLDLTNMVIERVAVTTVSGR